jgi:hypothetical protein
MVKGELKRIGKRLAALTVLLACLVVAFVGEFETKGQAQGGCCVGVCCSSCLERFQGCLDRGEEDCARFYEYCNDVCNFDC